MRYKKDCECCYTCIWVGLDESSRAMCYNYKPSDYPHWIDEDDKFWRRCKNYIYDPLMMLTMQRMIEDGSLCD